MKGHERDPRWSRRRRDTCILWSLGIGALVTLLWLTVFMTLLLTTGDQVFRRRYPRLAPHPFALVFGADGASALARKKHGTDGYLSRHQAQSMFEELDVGASHEQATRLLGANRRASAADLDRLFRVPSSADLNERVSLRGSVPAHR